MIQHKVVTVYAGTDFWAQGELCEGLLFLHCDVYKWDRKTLRKIKEGLQILHEGLRNQYGYDKPIFSYTENPRWCKLIGGKYHNSFEHEGRHFEVFKWESKL